MIPTIQKIVSGGQTGADRAALDAAMQLGIPTGGWVPRGRRAEDGVIPARYRGLVETESADYSVRTEANVRDSDATLIVSFGPPAGGTALTARLAARTGRPCLVLDLEDQPLDAAAGAVRQWLAKTGPQVLNVAGPRAGGEPRIGAAVETLLLSALSSGDD